MARGVADVDDVMPLGCPRVVLFLFRSQATLSEGDVIGADDLAAGDQLQQMVLLQNEDRVNPCWNRGRLARKQSRKDQKRKGSPRASCPIPSPLWLHQHSGTLEVRSI